MPERTHQVVIIGGGFGGLYAAQTLKRAPVEVTLIDRRNFHLFQPLLYQVATGGLSPANIAAPLRAVLKKQKNTSVLMAEVIDIDAANKRVVLQDGAVPYDSLIVATGSRHHYFGKEQWEPLAPGLKTVEDATEIRRRVLSAFEDAERETDPAKIASLLTFVIVGGGPTGVELAGALSEIARHTLRGNFRRINPGDARIILLDAADRVLPPYPSELSKAAAESLSRLGVTVRTGCGVTDLKPGEITIKSGDKTEVIAARTVLWAAGVVASPLGRAIARATGAEIDKSGRVIVEPDLSVKGHPDIFVIGDLASYKHGTEKPLPGVAPVAMQQGRYAAELIAARLRGRTMPAFKYRDHGNMATIGRSAAVADIRNFRFSGFFAWLLWLFVHLMYLVTFQNRVLVLMQWAANYITRNRSARLITDPAALAPVLPPEEKAELAAAHAREYGHH